MSDDDEVAEAEVIDGPTTADPAGGELAVRVTPGLMEPVAPLARIRDAFTAYTDAVEALTDRDDYQVVQGKRFPKKSALRKLGTAFGVSSEIVSREIHRDDEGRVQWAEFIVRASAPNGRMVEAFGECSLTDKCSAKCKDDHDPASHFSHANHDIPSTAETRARNRAFSDLFAMGQVTAEEAHEPELWERLGWPSEAGFCGLMDPLSAALKSNGQLSDEWKAWRAEREIGWPVAREHAVQVRIWMQEHQLGETDEYDVDRPAGAEGPGSSDPGTGGTPTSARDTPAAPPRRSPAGEDRGAAAEADTPARPASAPAAKKPTTTQLQRLAILCNEIASTTLNTADLSNDDLRHALVYASTGGRVDAATKATRDEVARAIDDALKVQRGALRLDVTGEVDRPAELVPA